jgi:hypothetical protein
MIVPNRAGLDTRVDLYSKAKSQELPTADSRVDTVYANRTKVGGGEPVHESIRLQHDSSVFAKQGIITRGTPQTDPRLMPASKHYLPNYADRLAVSGWHGPEHIGKF